ncbi:heavy-metal-associated domain-containing protein [Flavobacterium franklandianum]|uniref:Metal transporter n=1 Tax=Flavobacterium franklandianum TaxID=2594430 RepID=A0A553CQL8_9FLAO|nr:cation transporter [Flavobacterium franklandianum]TRX22836.1 metal transporter [Flavobacterium franklandianum]
MKSTIHEHQKNNFKIVSKNLFLGMMLIVVTLSVQAQDKKNKNAKYTIAVNGNCEQCQRRIQKAAFSVTGVKMASWSIETHKLDITLNEEKTSITEVKKAVAKVGHDTEGEKATQEDYDNLHGCCKYDREESNK